MGDSLQGLKAKARKVAKRERRNVARAALRAGVRKVAVCSRCRAWFPTTAERNAHRAEHRERARIARVSL